MKTNLLRSVLLITGISIFSTAINAQYISAGSFHSMALCTIDSTVRSWGGNMNGQLGVNDTLERNSPVAVHGPGNTGFLRGIVAVVIRENFSLALKSDGTVWAWGYNGDGESGNNTKIDNWVPVQVHGPGNIGFLTGIIAISGGYNHVLALRNDSTVWAWGDNSTGELGDNTIIDDSTPVQVHGPGNIGFLTGIVSIAAGQQFSLVTMKDGSVWSWGYNGVASLGDYTTIDRHTPVQVHGANNVGFLTGVTSIAGGGGHALAIKKDSTLWSWGFNVNGELGDNTTNTDSIPEQVHGSGNVGFLTGVIYAKAGDYFSGAITKDSNVWAWGFNYYGQCGINDTLGEEENTPVWVHGLNNIGYLSSITAISLGDEHALALKDDGSLYTWGWNGNGQLGDDSTIDRWYPISAPEPCSVQLSVPTIQYSNSLTLYPNPASNYITVISDNENITGIEIYNVMGQMVYNALSSFKNKEATVNVSSLPDGVYMMRLLSNGNSLNKEFIVQK
jgi:alpha-tubulin suppressor-like RCC1 family protein